MKILDQAIFMLLDIGAYEQQPSDALDGFTDRLITLIPTLQSHGCSVGGPGGSIQRLRRGTWIGHIAEHVALELQCLAGMEVGFGKTYDTDADPRGRRPGEASELVRSGALDNGFAARALPKFLRHCPKRQRLNAISFPSFLMNPGEAHHEIRQ